MEVNILTNSRIDDLLKDFIEKSLQNHAQETSEESSFGLTTAEYNDWQNHEPDFTKRIVTPLHPNRHQTRRYQSLVNAHS